MATIPRWPFGRTTTLVALLAALASASGLAWYLNRTPAPTPQPSTEARTVVPSGSRTKRNDTVVMSPTQQEAVGLQAVKAELGAAYDMIAAPGKVVPDETHFAHITPRVPGVVKSVEGQIGQDVRKGDVLAVLESPEVAQARLDLLMRNQELEVAKTRLDWQSAITAATLELIERLQAGDSPQDIQERFKGRSVGENREKLLTADSQRRVTRAAWERSKGLMETNAVSLASMQLDQAEHEAALATYQSLMDRVGVEARLADTQARQAKQQAEISVRVARSHLSALGIPAEAEVEVEVASTVSPGMASTQPAPTPEKSHAMSLFSIRAPFAGTILDRELIVPGVAVAATQKIYTIANLSSVWIEVHVHESKFGALGRTKGASVTLQTPAFPDREFAAQVIYAGDLVDENSRSVKLLAHAENPGRVLKPGMYVDVVLKTPSGQDAAIIPATALLSDGATRFVYVRTKPDRFQRREVVVGNATANQATILQGLEPGDEVVTQGAFKLKAEAIRLAAGPE